MADMFESDNSANEHMISSLLNKLVRYADTSNKKDIRIKEISEARQILEYICNVIQPDNYVSNMMYKGFSKLLIKANEAEKYPDELQDFKQEIAFLHVIKG